MVAQAGRYCGTPFNVHLGFTQGVPFSPTILNSLMDSVIYHWVTLVVVEEAGPEGFGLAVQ